MCLHQPLHARLGLALLASLTLCFLGAGTANAQGFGDNLLIEAGADNLDGPTLKASAQTGSPGQTRLGGSVQAGLVRERFVGGYTVGTYAQDHAAQMLEARLWASWNLHRRQGQRFDLATGLGTRLVFAKETTPAGDRSTALLTRISPSFSQDLSPTLTLFASIHLDTDIALDPAAELDMSAIPMELGLSLGLTDHWSLRASGLVGGAFGYGGDGAKYRAAGALGVGYSWGVPGPELEEEPSSLGYFVDAGWRGYAIGGHLSHGPEVRGGVSLWSRRLKVGLAMQSRPGPMNPKTFTLRLEEGAAYRGKEQLELRSDGANVGLLVAPVLPLLPWLELELPLTLGQAAYGFYLTGEDRVPPEGKRTSEVENDLQAEKDASFTIGIDAGVRARLNLPAAPWIQPMLGVHYLWTPGYDAFLSDDYSGLSVALGVQFATY